MAVCMYVHMYTKHYFYMHLMHLICKRRLVILEYNSVKARLFNSRSLFDSRNLILYAINEATLVMALLRN